MIQKSKFIQDVSVGNNKGKLFLVGNEYRVFHEKENPTLAEKLELLTKASEITAELQGITQEMQLSASYIEK